MSCSSKSARFIQGERDKDRLLYRQIKVFPDVLVISYQTRNSGAHFALNNKYVDRTTPVKAPASEVISIDRGTANYRLSNDVLHLTGFLW